MLVFSSSELVELTKILNEIGKLSFENIRRAYFVTRAMFMLSKFDGKECRE